MGSYDFIYGSEVLVQCQAQLNILPWDITTQPEYQKYIILIKKDSSFFTYWLKPRKAVICQVSKSPNEYLDREILDKIGTKIDDFIRERERVLVWSRLKGKKPHPVSHSGHGKIRIELQSPTFCARDMGITFDPDTYKFSIS